MELLVFSHRNAEFCKKYILDHQYYKSIFTADLDLWEIAKNACKKTTQLKHLQFKDVLDYLTSPAMIILSEQYPFCYKSLTELSKPLLADIIKPISSLLEFLLEVIIAKTGLPQNKFERNLLNEEHKADWDLLNEKITSCIAGAFIAHDHDSALYQTIIDELISKELKYGYNFGQALDKIQADQTQLPIDFSQFLPQEKTSALGDADHHENKN